MDRYLKFLWNRNIVYRQDPINDIPDVDTDQYMFYKNGTYECYDLFRSKAKINTFRSLKWHLLVIWYLNPEVDQDQFEELAKVVTHKPNGFVSAQQLQSCDKMLNELLNRLQDGI